MKKIVFGITGLTLGGAERVLVDLANELSEKYNITIFTLYGNGEFEKELSKKVKLIQMNNKRFEELSKLEKIKISLKLLFNKKYIYKKYINDNYDVEIAFLEGPITRLFSVKNKNTKKIAWVHNDIRQVFGKNIKAKIKTKLDKLCYLHYNDIVFVSKDNKVQFEEIYKLKINKLVIPNYISSKRVIENAEKEFENIFDNEKINFLTVARLTKQKAIDRLIKVHSDLIKKGFDHKIYVIGEGPENKNLNELIKKYNVEETFILLGKRNNPYPYIKNCDIFALLSNYEGLPITILEAKTLNKPIIITNTASREAVQNYKKSYITENSEDGVFQAIKYGINMLENWKKENNQLNLNNVDIIKKIEELVNE